ncbi:peptide/nickel transport system permease protein [Aliiruegeria lutimaris]|uniref:Peptide/nickel transport system permease protein n=2 Tax=Aliiruegeria lutimaris TaxID=571298 RepID=A0A1G9D6R5_9RHOB|nr:peptide/nickel transport system permease protein [Aliiruegeria lutimaris]
MTVSPDTQMPGHRLGRPMLLDQLLRHKGGAFGLAIMLLFIFLAAFGRFVAPYDPNANDYVSLLSSPSASHWFGTDELGRDTLSRVIDGSRIAVAVAFLSVSIAMAVGVVIGVVSGYFGGYVDAVLNRSQDVLFAFPTLLLAIILVAVLGPGLFNASLAIAIVYSPRFARMARASALSIKSSEFLDAARLAGVSTPVILIRHILPNVLPPVIVLAALSMSTAQLAYASLSFLGLGVSPPQADWGSMLSKGRDFITIAPWLVIWPTVALVLLMLAFNVLGDAIRDVLDPNHSSIGKNPDTLL